MQNAGKRLDHDGLFPNQIMVLRTLPCHKSGLAKNEDRREEKNLVRAAGVEPTTFGSGGRRSIQLSYARTRFRQKFNACA